MVSEKVAGVAGSRVDPGCAVEVPRPSQRRRVLLITYEFQPSLLMGAQACAQIARFLPAYGWEPVVLTVQERYCDDVNGTTERAAPGLVVRTGVIPHPLSVYKNVKASLRRDPNGAGFGTESFERMGAVRRWVLSLLQTPDVHTGWILPATLAGLRVIRRGTIHHLLSSGPSWTNHLVGLALSRLTGLPWTVHFRDPWTQIIGWKPVSALSARIERALETTVLRHADVVVCVTDRHTGALREAHPELPPEKFVTIPNGYDGSEWDRGPGEGVDGNPRERGEFVVTFAGNLYNRLTPVPLFRALKALVDSGEIERERIRIDLFGWCDWVGDRRVTELAAECGVGDRVRVRGPLSRAETLRKLADSDLLLVLADGLPLQIPGKTYEYLRTGRPILALTSAGALADLLRRTGGAWVVDPADETRLQAALRDAYRCWRDGLAGPVADTATVSGFDRRALAGRFAELFDGNLAEHRRRGTSA